MVEKVIFGPLVPTQRWITKIRLTRRLLHVHHESLESKQGLKLLLLITQVLLQQSGSLADLLGVDLVRVVT